MDVAVLEAKQIGWGASGRAFGQVVPYLKQDHPAILRHYGAERGQRVVDAVADGPSLVFDLIERHRIDCWPVRTGLIFAAHSPAGQRALAKRTAYWQQRGAPVEQLEGSACAELIGSHRYTHGVAGPARRAYQSVRLCAWPRTCGPGRGRHASTPQTPVARCSARAHAGCWIPAQAAVADAVVHRHQRLYRRRCCRACGTASSRCVATASSRNRCRTTCAAPSCRRASP